MKNKVFFRADGNSQIGLGHIFRSLALAEMLRNDFDCHFIIRQPIPSIKTKILEVCNKIIELPETENHEKEALFIVQHYLKRNEIVVLDGYYFKTRYQKIIRAIGCKIVCIDDIHNFHFVADVVINHAGGVSPAAYSAEPYTLFYLGLPYAMLRKPFLVKQSERELPPPDNNILICFGGADPTNETLKALQKCELSNAFNQCYVITGAAYPYQNELDKFVRNSNLKVTILTNLDTHQMATFMKKCQTAITSPSTIAYEYLSIGGLLYLSMTADNQLDIYNYFLYTKIAFALDDFPGVSNDAAAQALLLQQSLLDGKSSERILKIFKSLVIPNEVVHAG